MTSSAVNQEVERGKLVILIVLAILIGVVSYLGTQALSARYESDFPAHWTEQDYYLYTEVNDVMREQGYLEGSDLDKESFERQFNGKDISLYSVVQDGQAYSVLKKDGSWYVIATK